MEKGREEERKNRCGGEIHGKEVVEMEGERNTVEKRWKRDKKKTEQMWRKEEIWEGSGTVWRGDGKGKRKEKTKQIKGRKTRQRNDKKDVGRRRYGKEIEKA